MSIKKNWVFCLIIEFVVFSVWGLLILFIPTYFVFSNTVFSFVFTVVLVLLKESYHVLIQHKPLKSQLYRMTLMAYEGVVLDKHMHKSLATVFLREYILFNTGGKQHKIYIAEPSNGETRNNLSTFNIGDTGTLHYRKGKKHLYFEEFEKGIQGEID
jgi:hypothetical protein